MTQLKTFTLENALAVDACDRLDHVVSDFVDVLGNLGALAAIHVEGVGQVTFTAGHSDIEKLRAVQPTDVFQIGSQSKTITAMVLLLMERDGLLHLDDPVHLHLDLPIDRRITIRHLLMNASGLGEYTLGILPPRLDPRIVYSPRDLVALALPQGQIFEPGARFDYCNTGWVIGAMIIERVDQRSYAEAAAARIVGPLGLRSTSFGGTFPPAEPMRCYMALSMETTPIETTRALSWAFGAGDGVANACDMLALYGSLLREDSPLGITLSDLVRDTKAPIGKPYFALSLGTEYALGLERRAYAGSEVWGHPGSTGASRTSTWIDAKRRVSVTTAVTTVVVGDNVIDELRYPRAQLFAMVLNTAYALAETL